MPHRAERAPQESNSLGVIHRPIRAAETSRETLLRWTRKKNVSYPRNSSLVPLPKSKQEHFILRCFLIIFRFQFCLWVSRYNEKNESTLRKACGHLTQGQVSYAKRPSDLHKLRWLILLLASSFFTARDESLKKQNNLSTVTKPGKGLGQPLNPARQATPRARVHSPPCGQASSYIHQGPPSMDGELSGLPEYARGFLS